jgi:hydroxymethylpyrimidine/phosphomethylpyrimidine kinase
VTRPVVLTIAGSDSGGGAGIPTDLRTMTALGAFGTCAVTCVTAQNLAGVTAVAPIPPAVVKAQIEAVANGFPVRAVKTGMLFSREIIHAVVEALDAARFPSVVVDPVMAAASGARLLEPDAEAAYARELLPRATVMTPNLDEAEVLWGRPVTTEAEMVEAATALARRFKTAVFLKGGHLAGDPVDLLVHGDEVHRWQDGRVGGVLTHGSGCTLSAAVAARLALGDDLAEACAAGRRFVREAFLRPQTLESGAVLLGVPGRD